MSVGIYPENYPVTYHWLNKEQQEKILQWFKKEFNAAQAANKDRLILVRDIYESGHKRYQDAIHRIQAAQEALEILGIFVEYDWIGHREEWFLATRQDAEMQEEHLFCMYSDG